MNFGGVMLALLLISGVLLGIFVIAGSAQEPYVDSFGAVQGNSTNSTQAQVNNVTASVANAAGGIILFIAVAAIFVTVVALMATVGKSHYGGRR